MNWYRRKIKAATLPIESLNKAIEGTFRNMIPGIKKFQHLPINAGQNRIGQSSTFSFYAEEEYPVFYRVEFRTEMTRNAQTFETDARSDSVTFSLTVQIDKDWTYAMFEKQPEWSSKIPRLKEIIQNMSDGGMGMTEVVYYEQLDSVYEAARELMRVMDLIDNLLDSGDDGENDGEETEPWFPGDPAADWEFEQEEGDLQPVRVPNQQQSFQRQYQ